MGRTRWIAVPLAVGLALAGLAAPASAAEADTEAPTTPGTIVASDITTSSVTLTWAASTDNVGVTGYELRQQYFDMIMLRSVETNAVTLTGLSASVTYRFAARALDAAGNVSPLSAWTTVTLAPGDTTPPSVPGKPIASDLTGTSVTLTWTRSTDNVVLNAYEIYRYQDGAAPVVLVLPQHPPQTYPTMTLTGLTPGATYTFAVRARDDVGNTSEFSPSTVVVMPLDAVPTCAVDYAIAAQWPGGFQTSVTIHNDGTETVSGWTLRWRFADGQTIDLVWLGVLVEDED
ncbi:MAG: endoglucanase, partial [Dactylosporangium sp.]|nr:endoglucanase [Dactylosporangium sp.]